MNVLQNNALKEYIVLKNANAPNAITFRFSAEGLTLTESDGVRIFLDEQKNEVFRLDRLFAVDGNGDMTEELTYTFSSVKGSRDILVTVTLDPEYLTAENRAFPVVIDPSVMISSAQTADASVYSGKPDTNYQMETRLRTGKDTTYGKRRAYLRFNLPSNIPASKVTEATLDLKKHSGVAPAVRAYRCESSWASGTITWNNMPSYTPVNLSSESVPRSSGSAWYEMDVTLIVKDWLANENPNYGFVVRDNVESNTDRWTTFYSSDAPSPNKPELHITYSGEEIEPDTRPTETTTPTKPNPSVTLVLQYDHAYGLENPADPNQSNEGNTQIRNSVYAMGETVRDFYHEKYNLEVNLLGPYRKQNYVDQHIYDEIPPGVYCVSSELIGNEESYTISFQEYHCTNNYNILCRMTPSDDKTAVKMMFVGHDICFHSELEGHTYNSATENDFYGLSYKALRSMIITDECGGVHEAITAIHEFGHMFGITDHYLPKHPYKENTDEYCIYGSKKEQITSIENIAICPGCTVQLMDNLYEYTSTSN